MGAILEGSTSLDHTACGRARRRPDHSLDMIFSRLWQFTELLTVFCCEPAHMPEAHLLAMSATNVLGSELINSFRTAASRFDYIYALGAVPNSTANARSRSWISLVTWDSQMVASA